MKTQIRAIREKSLEGKVEATTAPNYQLQQGLVRYRRPRTGYRVAESNAGRGGGKGSSSHRRVWFLFKPALCCLQQLSHPCSPGRQGKLRPRGLGKNSCRRPSHVDWSSWLKSGPSPQQRPPLAFYPLPCLSPLPGKNQRRVEVQGGSRIRPQACSWCCWWAQHLHVGDLALHQMAG